MINSIGTASNSLIQNYTVFKGKNLSEGKSLQTEGQEKQSVKLELTEAANSKNLNVSKNIINKVPREYTIAIETLESCINHINDSLEKADSMNLSYEEGLKFLKAEGEKWVENIRENDPEMFVQWLKSNKEKIMMGHSDLANLSPDFTMKDYYSYVKEPFSILV
ncbi:MAG: hypothetical protein N4A63_14385 [Vallitalea sp.]|jgi:hypothetical protein|nr:hypothetical protein [Vallitalea sp.]